jgi:hypothetical protein
MTTDKIWSARPRKAAGPERPRYFDEGDVDRVMAILLALASEVASIRERLDAHERVAAQGALPARELVEGYIADAPKMSRNSKPIATHRTARSWIETGAPDDIHADHGESRD